MAKEEQRQQIIDRINALLSTTLECEDRLSVLFREIDLEADNDDRHLMIEGVQKRLSDTHERIGQNITRAARHGIRTIELTHPENKVYPGYRAESVNEQSH